jgi:hypothetical protein
MSDLRLKARQGRLTREADTHRTSPARDSHVSCSETGSKSASHGRPKLAKVGDSKLKHNTPRFWQLSVWGFPGTECLGIDDACDNRGRLSIRVLGMVKYNAALYPLATRARKRLKLPPHCARAS